MFLESLSNQPIKLEIRSRILLTEEKAHGMQQNGPQHAVAQMPQIASPNLLHLTTISQLTEQGSMRERTRPKTGRW